MIKHFIKLLILFTGLIALGLLIIFVVSYLSIPKEEVENTEVEVVN